MDALPHSESETTSPTLDLDRVRVALQTENLDGWIFYNIRHRDRLSDAILGIPGRASNTRPWVYLLNAHGDPAKIVHQIEPTILDHLPGTRETYGSRGEFVQALKALGLRGKRTAAQYAQDLPPLSFLDHGAAQLFVGLGIVLVSAANLVQRFAGTLDTGGIHSHEGASRHLYEVVRAAWDGFQRSLRDDRELSEQTVCDLLRRLMKDRQLTWESGPMVAAGRSSANPHHESGHGVDHLLKPGDVVQFDIWARLDQPHAVYADISWVGVLAPHPTGEMQEVFDVVLRARDAAYRFVADEIAAGRPPTGCEVDRVARRTIGEGGFGAYIRHRTGHSIGAVPHGYGVNLDSVEFPDDRRIVEGSCFSIEPGIYLPSFGMRSEINVYVRGSRAVVSGAEPQTCFLTLEA